MSNPDPTKNDISITGFEVTVLAFVVGVMAVVVSLSDRIPPAFHSLILVGLSFLLLVVAFLIFKRHSSSKWLAYVTAIFALIIVVYAFIAWRSNPSSASSNISQCTDYYDRKLYEQAIDCFNKLPDISSNFKAKKYIGLSYMGLGKYDEAAKVFKDLFSQNQDEIRPHISEAYNQLALKAARSGNKQEAIRYQTILRVYDPERADKLNVEINH